ncbi:type II toxin-antitoxin system RelE/ParE family toxin [Enterococcus gallinarum]|uniref:type II toxin-antitoxin system RelE/ParE family toxin n=1 Tax=Enterococcus gallinarum TaxID=1353 RepID=UPI001D17AA6A|nr:plasmid maintenance system killer protein [Enterococcus gallinarum]MCC4044734.1 plasmid maintenance system killer protein [Enterococcus gallinarum]
MIIKYANRKDEKILGNERKIKQYYGKHHKNLSIRLSELRAANCLCEIPDVPPPRRHKLKGGYAKCWGIDISANYRIIIEPSGTYSIDDLQTINEIKILNIEDYH